ncbi:transcription initiation factor TFIID subunit 6-like isoform X2 [Euphorbia lathyris]|uniref:transcription initiation factor TFIID subunit 6-like isoform X2 n=1 Tax=Euphorbia lathyris TaxID=212925 RepID=UPI0033138655
MHHCVKISNAWLREIMEEAIKCMRHSRRIIVTSEDVDNALTLRNAEPVYGLASGDPGHNDLYYIDDKHVIEARLHKSSS